MAINMVTGSHKAKGLMQLKRGGGAVCKREKMVMLGLKLSPAEADAIKAEASAEGRSISNYLRQIVLARKARV